MGEWLTIGGVVLAWLLALVGVAVVRLVRARGAVDDAWDDLADAIQQRHDLAIELGELAGARGVTSDVADRVSEARLVAELPGATSPMEQASAERGLDMALRGLLAQTQSDRRLVGDRGITDLSERVATAQQNISDRQRDYDLAARQLASRASAWPGRLVARHMGMRSDRSSSVQP